MRKRAEFINKQIPLANHSFTCINVFDISYLPVVGANDRAQQRAMQVEPLTVTDRSVNTHRSV